MLAVGWVDGRLRAYVAEHRIPVRWTTLELGWSTGVRVSGLVVEHASLQATVAHAHAELGWARGGPTLRRLTIEGVEAILELPAAETPSDATPAERSDLLARLPEMRVTDVRATVKRGGLLLFQADAADLRLTPGEGQARVEGAARLSWGPMVAPVRYAGTLEAHPPGLDLAVEGQDGAPAFTLRRRDRFIEIPTAHVEWRAGVLDARLPQASVRLGPSDAPRVLADGDATLRRAPGEPWTVGLEHGAIFARWPSSTSAGGASGEPSPPPAAPPDLRVVVKDSTLGLLTEAGREPLLEHVVGVAFDGLLSVAGEAFGGAFSVDAAFEPGERLPRALDLTLDGVDLGAAFERVRPTPAPPARPLSARPGGFATGRVAVALTDLDLPTDPRDAHFELDAVLAVHDARLDAPAVADATLEVPHVELRLPLSRRSDAIVIHGARLGVGALTGRVALTVTDPDGDPFVDLDARLEPADCQAALDSLPRALLGPYDRVQATGRLAPFVDLTVPLRRPEALTLTLEGLRVGCQVTALNARSPAWPPVTVAGQAPGLADVDWLKAPFVRTVTEGVSGRVPVRVGPGTSGFVPTAELPAYVAAAMYLSEEIDFYETRAINRGLVWRALRLNLAERRFVYGGSTVGQQLVKNLFLTREKTLARKLQEILIADRMADAVSKDRVLELYVNCIEFGPDLYGIGPAARFYFGKDARALDPVEAVFLAMLKPAPRQGPWMVRRGRLFGGRWWAERMDALMGRLVEYGYLSAAEAQTQRPYDLRWEDGRYVGRGETVPL